MARRGMSTTLKVAMVAIVILIVAVIVLTIFSGGVDKVGLQINKFFDWISGHDIGALKATGEGCSLGIECESGVCAQGACAEPS